MRFTFIVNVLFMNHITSFFQFHPTCTQYPSTVFLLYIIISPPCTIKLPLIQYCICINVHKFRMNMQSLKEIVPNVPA